MNPMQLLKLKGYWNEFIGRHPKLPGFFQNASGKIGAGSVISVTITDPNGKSCTANIKVHPKDVELFHTLKNMK